MKMAASMSSQRKRKHSEKQNNTGRHQLYDWTKQIRKFSLKWKDDFPRDSLEENNRIQDFQSIRALVADTGTKSFGIESREVTVFIQK